VSEELLPIMSHHQAIIKPSSSHHQDASKPSSSIVKPSSSHHLDAIMKESCSPPLWRCVVCSQLERSGLVAWMRALCRHHL